MQDLLSRSELFADVDPEVQSKLFALAGRRSLAKGEYMFLLGDHADTVNVVLEGRVEICFPLSIQGSVKDVAVESIDVGRAFGLSAMVKPYRFTFSARAAEKTELATFARADLLKLAQEEPRVGCAFMSRLADVLGRRFLTMRTLWAREMQRSISSGKSPVSLSERD